MMVCQNTIGYGYQSQFGLNNCGGYPYGYPPVMPTPYQSQYSPFMNPPQMSMSPQQIAQNEAMAYQQQAYANAQQMPMNDNQPFTYVPGAMAPVQFENSQTGQQRAADPSPYVPGGVTVNQGGFNPATRTVTPANGATGYDASVLNNPYYKCIGSPMPPTMQQQNQEPVNPLRNPNYYFAGAAVKCPELNKAVQDPNGFYEPKIPCIGPNGYGPQITPQVQAQLVANGYQYQPNMGYVYNPGYMAGGYMRPGYNPNGFYGYPQNQFDYALNQILYEETPSVFDVKSFLEDVVLSDEERAKIDHNRSYNGGYIGVDYYGRPIYSNSYQDSQKKQQEFEQARKGYQDHFVKLSKIAHAYSGETIDEESARRRFDPCPPPPQQKQFNYYSATREEQVNYIKTMAVYKTIDLAHRFEQLDATKDAMERQRAYAFEQIKASHDKLIGVQPGEHYDLKAYLDNGYKLGINIAMQQAKTANRNGAAKYCGNEFRTSLAQRSSCPVPINSKDNEYVPIEAMIKSVYEKNAAENNRLMATQNGQQIYGIPAVGAKTAQEDASHYAFMKEMQWKKDKNDVRKAVTNYG